MENAILLSTGIGGLDDILYGGLAKGFLYLIEGSPGAGKTTLALQFLIEGAARGEKGLYISLAESEPELRQVADSHGFTLDNITVAKLSPPEIAGSEGQQYTVFQPAEVELADVLETVLAKVIEVKPSRIVIDSMSELRSGNIFRQFFTTKGSRGTSLGLWLTRDIVRRNRGSLRFRSRTSTPSGTVFAIYLPAEAPTVAEEGAGRVAKLSAEAA